MDLFQQRCSLKSGRSVKAVRCGWKSWVFPPDSEKPRDSRRKENKTETHRPEFLFPVYLYTSSSDDELNSFTADERRLYEGVLLFFRGEYGECCKLLGTLHGSTHDRYVRYGVLLHICLSCVYLHRFGKVFSLIMIFSRYI